jgi:hypothetical protein
MIDDRVRRGPRERRAVAMGTVTVLALLAVKFTPAIGEQRQALIASDADVVATAARLDAEIRSLPAIKDSLTARRARLAALDSAVLDAETLAAGSASLAEMLSDASKIAPIELGPVQLVNEQRDSTHREPFAPVAVRASLVGSVEAVMTFLTIIEQGPTLVNVRELSINRADAQQQSRPQAVRVELLVEALVRIAGGRDRR